MKTTIITMHKRTWKLPVLLSVITLIVLFISYKLFSDPVLIDTGIARLYKVFSSHTAGVSAVKFSADGKLLVSGSIDSTVIIRKRSTGEILQTLKHPEGITSLDISADDKYLITGSYDATVRLWDITSGCLVRKFQGHTRTVWAVAFSPNGRCIASAGEDAVINTWDIESGHILHALKGHALTVCCVKFSPDGSILASGSFDNKIKI